MRQPRSALGHQPTSRRISAASAIPPKADLNGSSAYDRFVPTTDILVRTEEAGTAAHGLPSSGKQLPH